MKTLLWKILGCRPMKPLYYYFTDKVNGRFVYVYVDKCGQLWMAHSKWALFRVPKKLM